MAKRSYLMRRPQDDDDDYYGGASGGNDLVHAKPIDERYSKILGETYKGKDFVRGSEKSQKHFYGEQTVVNDSSATTSAEPLESNLRPLTHDERNKISARIIKADMNQNKELVERLKAKLESGMTEVESKTSDAPQKNDDYVLLMKMDKKTGMVMPAGAKQSSFSAQGGSTDRGTVSQEYSRQMDLKEMVANERSSTAIDQVTMFGRAAKMCQENNTDDDWVVDDNIMSHPKKRRHEEKDQKKHHSQRIEEHKDLERTLESCKLCIDSKLLEKHSIVATGLKTYLAVVSHDGLGAEHCYIAPMAHYASSLLLDEDVYDEMKMWCKGLVAMWKDTQDGDEDDEHDCIFIENGKYANEQRHMTIECIPMPKEIGDLAPIYFKKAIMDSEKEWSDNKKLIDLSKPQYNGSIRKAVPKGFPFFAVNFGLQPGYVHVIENQELFPSTFAQEIVAGMLNLNLSHWRKVKPMSFSEIKEKRDKFRARWEKYDWTKIVKEALRNKES